MTYMRGMVAVAAFVAVLAVAAYYYVNAPRNVRLISIEDVRADSTSTIIMPNGTKVGKQ